MAIKPLPKGTPAPSGSIKAPMSAVETKKKRSDGDETMSKHRKDSDAENKPEGLPRNKRSETVGSPLNAPKEGYAGDDEGKPGQTASTGIEPGRGAPDHEHSPHMPGHGQ